MSYKGYSWSCLDVLVLLSVKHDPRKEENIIPCPFCGGKRFGMNVKKGAGRCFNCGASADSAGYYAAEMGMSLNDARDDIKKRLNIQDDTGKLPDRIVFKPAPQSEIAPVEVRDATYHAFLDEVVLSQKNFDNLIARGFTADDIISKGYKTFPSSANISFEDLCRRLLAKGFKLKGVPGFYQKKNGEWTFIKVTQGIIIPQINTKNQIEGFQIRKDDDLRVTLDDGSLEAKCVWFSSKNCTNGTGAHVSVHVATDFKYSKESHCYEPVLHGDTVTLTEGGMKADLCAALLDGQASFIAVPGVHSLSPLKDTLIELKKFGLKTVNLAFDMDYLTNPNVKEAMIKVQALIKELDLNLRNIMNWDYEIKKGNNTFYLKGIDDYLAYQYKKVVPTVATREQ